MRYVLYAFLIYLAYQFIFKLAIPIYVASRKFKKGFKEMHQRMEEQMRQQQGYNPQEPAPATSQPKGKMKAGDYIDFEEVK